jgi:DNA-binding NarL/FixJ family response regulator
VGYAVRAGGGVGQPIDERGHSAGSRDDAGQVESARPARGGASGLLLKDTQPAELLQALRAVTRGDSLLSPAVTRRLISEFVARPPDAVAASRSR